MTTKHKLVAIVGETASGKSSLAHDLATTVKGEIISADSRTIYKGMDIGTAKPTKLNQKEVQYHLLDIVSPKEKYSARQFQNDAYSALNKIYSDNHHAIMVGGTGLFVDSVLFDFKFREAPDSQKREQLNSLDLNELQQKALKIDKNLDKNLLSNKRHLIRLIETGSIRNDDKKLRENTIVIGLKLPRTVMRKRIEQRVESMFKQGLRKEVEELVEAYGWGPESMTGIGYQEFKDYYDGLVSMSEVKRRIVKNTLKYAKRQRTWFKRNPHIQWFDSPKEALDYAVEWFD